MLQIVRKLFLAGLIVLGIASLLATPAPLPQTSELVVKTRNPIGPPFYYNSLFVKKYPNHLLRLDAACKGDSISVGWDILDSGTALVTSLPKTSISPNFDQIAVSAKGSQKSIISSEVSLILTAPKAVYKQTIKLLPNEICTGFPIIPIGKYEGSFQRKSPDPKELKRYIYLYWKSTSNENLDRMVANIYETEPQNSDEFHQAISVACSLQAEIKQIICDSDGKSSLKMVIKVSETGLNGNYSTEETSSQYSGITGTGSFSFTKIP